ncbi:unnamed protein product [Bursaphelenchus xylophilus]|uniref:(pine wood nematode) hypothetical protein n=1 Tax=Bursaphelenchus xylophilus TaxID=6326 RepID=A0A1I7SVK0_BURXY|nr:unnamed protein product [Bursaphelenchus xylophilus]CAG9101574.1 unnamed protein product [Bursaphelenchus xylophilus]
MAWLQFTVFLAVAGLNAADTFCESHKEVHPTSVRTNNQKFPMFLSHGPTRTYTSEVLEFNWRWFSELKLGSQDVFSLLSAIDSCTNIVWGDTVLLLLSRTTSMEHLIGRTTIISDCEAGRIFEFCVNFLGDGKCDRKDNCTVVNAGKRPGSLEIGSVEICSKDLDEFFDRSTYNRTFDLLEMGVVVDRTANRPHLIDLTGRGKADFCSHRLSPPDITVDEWRSAALLQAAWPLLRRFELPENKEDFLQFRPNRNSAKAAVEQTSYVCEYIINGIYTHPTCDWNGSTDLSVLRRQLHTENWFAKQLNRTLFRLERRAVMPMITAEQIEEYQREFQASEAMNRLVIGSMVSYAVIALCIAVHLFLP